MIAISFRLFWWLFCLSNTTWLFIPPDFTFQLLEAVRLVRHKSRARDSGSGITCAVHNTAPYFGYLNTVK